MQRQIRLHSSTDDLLVPFIRTAHHMCYNTLWDTVILFSSFLTEIRVCCQILCAIFLSSFAMVLNSSKALLCPFVHEGLGTWFRRLYTVYDNIIIESHVAWYIMKMTKLPRLKWNADCHHETILNNRHVPRWIHAEIKLSNSIVYVWHIYVL